MTAALWIAGYVLWLGWCAQAFCSMLLVRKFSRRFEWQRREAFGRYRPRAAIIVPFRGLEPNLVANIRGLCNQEYPDYFLIFVVDSEDDPSYEVLRRETARLPDGKVDILVAGAAGRNEGQKVHNQIAALEYLREQQRGELVWVFADSDAIPHDQWLAELIGPLGQDKTGVTTGYRWLVPEPNHHGRLIWGHLASVMNSTIGCFYGRDKFNHAWGGSMATRVETAVGGDLVGRLRGALCDDYVVTAMSRDMDKRVYFVARCMIATPVHFTLAQLLEFGHRQYMLTRVHAPLLIRTAIGFHGLYILGFITAVLGLVLGLAFQPGKWGWVLAAAALGFVHAMDVLRSVYRRHSIRRALGVEVERRLRTTLRYDRWATPLWMGLHLYIAVRAMIGRKMWWRGIPYRLLGPNHVERLDVL